MALVACMRQLRSILNAPMRVGEFPPTSCSPNLKGGRFPRACGYRAASRPPMPNKPKGRSHAPLTRMDEAL